MRVHHLTVLAIGICIVPAAAKSQDRAAIPFPIIQPAADLQATAETTPVADSGAADSPFAVAAIGDSGLSVIAGREDTTQIALNEQFAGVTNNSIGNNSVTGEARISDNAFQNMSGLSILNVNTGNNVAINASMSVNVSIIPAP